MTVGQALAQGAKLLDDARVPVPRLTAEVLLAHAIGCERIWLVAHSTDELREVWWIHYGRYLHQRLQGQPTQQITGRQEFYGREFRVTRDVLIPRPETEHVIEAALQLAPDAHRILDIGTGSGAIAVTLALELTDAHVAATDLSEAAVRVAAGNARRLRARVDFAVCDLGSALSDGAFDLVVSNPPYVPAREKAAIQREVREHEPELALYGGEDGLEVYRRLIPEAARLLAPGGWLIMEIGYALEPAVGAMLGAGSECPWTSVETRADLAGLPRVMCGRRA
jgi:release factor glutamine methyltransferase